MDKAVIVGVFEFLGFHLCQTLLNNGIEVDGLHLGSNDDGFFLEEKRMEIGRNANFKEYFFRDYQWTQDERQESVVIVDYYDLFMRRKETEFFALELIKGLLSHLKTSKDRAVFLLPVQFLSKEGFEKERTQVERLFGLLKKRRSAATQKFYLPTVYGPWQPEEFSFQKHFFRGDSSHKPFKANEREWLADAIYIEETVQTILHYCRKDKEEYLLTSGKTNQWANCANYLSLPTTEETQGQLKHKSETLTIPVRKNTPIETALAQQQHHTERLKSLY